MFNWSGNKGSFKGQIPFYGKTGIDFYTERKVGWCLLKYGCELMCRRLLLYGLRVMLLDTKLPSTCLSFSNWRVLKSGFGLGVKVLSYDNFGDTA
jgi:hypothetical protein